MRAQLTLFILLLFTSLLFAQSPFNQWEPDDGIAVRQSKHIEWFKSSASRLEGELVGEVAYVWSDCRSGDRGIYLQVMDSDGEFKFQEDGILVADGFSRQEDPEVLPCSDGGWFVVWIDYRNSEFGDIYCTKIDADGEHLWGDAENGVVVCDAQATQITARIVEDSGNGCIIAWIDYRQGGSDIYAQHILNDGSLDEQWAENGIAVAGLWGPEVQIEACSDEDGGMILTWKDGAQVGDFNIAAQRVTEDGEMVWADGGRVMVCDDEGAQERPDICPDGNGGAFIAWADDRNVNNHNRDIYIEHIDSDGNILWGEPGAGVALCTADEEQSRVKLIYSEAGTAIVVWEDRRENGQEYDIYTMRVGGADEMIRLWGPAQGMGIVVADGNQSQSSVAPDGDGGMYLVWEEERFGGFPETDIWGQRISVDGEPLWGEDGIVVCGADDENDDGLNHQGSPAINLISGNRCAMAWGDSRDGGISIRTQIYSPEGETQLEENGSLVSQGSSGNAIQISLVPVGDDDFAVVWQDGRFGGRGPAAFTQICQNTGDNAGFVLETNGQPVITPTLGGGIAPQSVSDDNGNILVVWEDHRGGRDIPYAIYAQKISADGERLWDSTGIKLAEFEFDQAGAVICHDGEGGLIAAWRAPTADDYFDIYVQRLDNNGNRLWGDAGILLTGNEMDEYPNQIIADWRGGAVIVWTASDPQTENDLYVERITGDGENLWGNGGLELCRTRGRQNSPVIRCIDGEFAVMWQDGRQNENGQTENDIYGQFIDEDGVFQWMENGFPVCEMALNQNNPVISFDDEGCIWVAWEDSRANGVMDIYVQRLTTNADQMGRPEILLEFDGDIALDGVPVCTAAGDQSTPAIVDDAHGGLWVVWEDYRNGAMSDIYGTHLREDGTPVEGWDENGSLICGAVHKQENPRLARLRADGSAGVVVVWGDKRSTGKEELSSVYMQRVDDTFLLAPGGKPSDVPESFEISRIYPNPFNSVISVEYSVPNPVDMRIMITDYAGRLVQELFSGRQNAGTYALTEDMAGVASGLYFLKLETAGFVASRKIVLLK